MRGETKAMSELALRLIEKEKKEKTKVLDLGRLGLKTLPEELFDLEWLEELYLCNEYWDSKNNKFISSKNTYAPNKLSIIPYSIVKFKNLKKLYIGGDFHNTWDINDITVLQQFPHLISLNIRYNKIHDIRILQHLKKLKSLNIGFNYISDISTLQHITQLTSLSCSDNRISDISVLKHHKQLLNLNLRRNEITDISILKYLPQLKILNLSANNIRDISGLQYLRHIVFLQLGDNKIRDLSALQYLSQLITLDISYNRITQLPSWLIQRKFRIVSGISFPIEKGICTIGGNRITYPPQEVVNQGHDAIVRFFEEIEKGVDYLYEAKLLLVGEGGVGKTTLRLKLEDPNAKMPAKEERTRGIDIIRYNFTKKDNTPFRINIWDFGGQDIYHATHRFFLTHRSFYILMTETRRQDDNFDYWIPNIRLFAGQSPILVVKNLMDGFRRHISIGRFLKSEKFNIREQIFDVNLKDNEGLNEVKNAIHYHIQRLPHVGQKVPASWTKIRKVMEELSNKHNYISFDQFIRVCEDNKITEIEKIYDLGKYFHDLGIILWYHHITALKSKVILRPHWATHAVYLMIDDETIQKQQGWFTKQDTVRVWSDKMYCHMHDELLELMKAFRLCYKKRYRNEYVIPSLLPADPPKDLYWDNADNLRLVFQYEFMPRGIVNQLTAELHRYIAGDERVWSRGVVFKDQGTKAKVEEIQNKQLIYINIKGIDARGLMRIIINALDEIHDTYPGIEVGKQVPCQCHACINNPEPTIFSYDKLLKWLNKGKREVVCNEGEETLQIEKILFNVGIIIEQQEREAFYSLQKHDKTLPPAEPLKVFISYSKKDKEYADRLLDWLKPLERRGEIATWHDRDLKAGEEWDPMIREHLQTADIILFLVSNDFIKTDYIWDIEITSAIEKHNRGEAAVIPIILRPCAWEGDMTPFSKLLALPDKEKTITTWGNEDKAWLSVFHGLKDDEVRND